MTLSIVQSADGPATPIRPVAKPDLEQWRGQQSAPLRRWLEQTKFAAEAGEITLLPDSDGNIAAVALGLGDTPDLWAYGALSHKLPAGVYALDAPLDEKTATGATLAWALGAYEFTRYRASTREVANLLAPKAADMRYAGGAAKGAFLARDLINTPAADMGPAELAAAAEQLAQEFGAAVAVIVGDDLLYQNYPAIHAVGRASAMAPRLIDLRWGDEDAPKVTLVGKGVCFDTGGLDLKAAAGMLRMKKDMGGAATVLGIAAMVMNAALPVRLRVLIPAVENAVSSTAYRPGDILKTRKGLTVEIGNTDAEGRIVLCDALTEADAERPALLFDMATLTGAARVALGPDLPALFCDDDAVAQAVLDQGTQADDPLWRLPLHAPYKERLNSGIADMNNVSEGPFAGAVTAALYLQAFVTETPTWAHIDTFSWNDKARPGRPVGGEALAMRALYGVIAERFPPR